MRLTIQRVRVVQLAIVALVMLILAAFLITRSMNLRESAREKSAQSLARNALMVQRDHYYGTGQYADADALNAGEPKVDATDDVAVQGKVFVRSEGHTTTMASSSKDGTCYWVRDTAGVASYATTPCDQEPQDEDFKASW